MLLTSVPSLGRGGRRKWPNLVVIWQLGGGGRGGGERSLQLREGGWGADAFAWRLESALTAALSRRLPSAPQNPLLGHAHHRPAVHGMPTNAAFGTSTVGRARVPGFAANRAGPSRSVGAGRRLCVPGGSGSRGSRRVVYWVLGLTAASRRRPAAWLGARVLAVGPTLFGSIAGVWTGKKLVLGPNWPPPEDPPWCPLHPTTTQWFVVGGRRRR